MESVELELPQTGQELRPSLLGGLVVAVGKTLQLVCDGGIFVAGDQFVKLPRRESLRERGVVVHLQDTEKLGEKSAKGVASVCALAVGSRVRRSIVLVVDVVAPVSSVPATLRRPIALICGAGSTKTEAATKRKSPTNSAEALGSEVVVDDGRESSSDACCTETRAVCPSYPDMTVVSLVDRLVAKIRVPFDADNPFLGRLDIEKLVHRLEVPECTLRQEDGYSGEHRVAEERV